MIKIELNNTILELHRLYFKSIIDSHEGIKLKKGELKRLNDNGKNPNGYKKENFYDAHNKFIEFCKENARDISTGDPSKLRIIISKVKKFNIFNYMIKNNVKFKLDNQTNKEYKTYGNLLCDILGYNNFGNFSYKVRYNFLPSEDERAEIINEVKAKNTGLSDSTISDFIGLLYIKLRITKDNILKQIGLNNFINYWGSYPFTFLVNISACPYCNRQYIAPILENDGRMRGDLDHFFTKEKYPYLSLSIYNLIPSCKFCNSSFKGKKEFDEDDLHPYEESINDHIKFKYRVLSNEIAIGVEKVNHDCKRVDNYIDMFKLEQQYDYHTEDVEELIIKSRIFTKQYLDNLRKTFNIKDISKEKLQEYIIGYKIDPEKINKVPLSKFRRDIIEQLDMDVLKEDKSISLTEKEIKQLESTIATLDIK